MSTSDEECRRIELSTDLIDRLAAVDDVEEAWLATLQVILSLTRTRRGAAYLRARDGTLRLAAHIGLPTLAPAFLTPASMHNDAQSRDLKLLPIGATDTQPSTIIAIELRPPRALTDSEHRWVALLVKQASALMRRARDRDAVQSSEERFRSIFQESNDFIITADLQQKITYCNPATATALGWSADEIIGRSISEFIPTPHFDRTSAMLDQKLREGGSTRYEVDVIDRKGRAMTWEINSRLTFGPDGRPTGLHAIARDVTTMRQAHEALRISERALREADQRKNEFLAMLAHELRNPLAPIRTAAQILRKPEAGPKQVEQASTIVERQVAHITRIVEDLLDVSRVTRGLVKLDLRPTALQDVIATAVEQVRPLLDGKQHRLSISMPEQPIVLSGESVRLVQIVSNLLSNAARHSGTHDTIELFVVANLQFVEIHVRDHGAGIAPDLLPRVFDLFAQGDRSAARSEGGLGIGLALVRRLAELHGGHVVASSAGAAKGAEFTVVLPRLADDTVGESKPQDDVVADAKPLRILIVDDNQDAADMLATSLQMDGHVTLVEYAAKTALARAASEAPDVMLLDIGLPDMSGYELAVRLRSLPQCATSTLVAVTGYGQDEDRRRSTSAGFDHHLTKPVSGEELKRVLTPIGRDPHPRG